MGKYEEWRRKDPDLERLRAALKKDKEERSKGLDLFTAEEMPGLLVDPQANHNM